MAEIREERHVRRAGRRGSAGLWLLALVGAAALSAVLALEASLTAVLLVCLILLLALPFVLQCASRQIEILAPVNLFAFLYFLAFVVKPVQSLLEGRLILPHLEGGPECLAKTLAAAILGLVSFYGGYYLLAGRSAPRPSELRRPPAVTSWALLRLVNAASIAGLVASHLYLAYSEGGLFVFLTKAASSRGELFYGRGYMLIINFMSWLSVMSAATIARAGGRSPQRSLWFWMCLTLALVAGALHTSRTAFVSVLWILPLYIHFRCARLKLRTVVLLLAGLFAMVTVYDVLRQPFPAQSKYASRNVTEILKTSFASSFVEAELFSIILQWIPDGHDYFYGQVELEALLYPLIPRAFFPQKKMIWGTNLIQTVYLPEYRFTTYSVSVLGPGYADFGWIGIVANLSLLGGILGYHFSRMHQQSSEKHLAVHLYLVALLTNIIRDGINVVLGQAPYLLALSIIYGLITGSQAPARARARWLWNALAAPRCAGVPG